MNKKGMNALAQVAIGIVLFIVAIAVGYKITDVVKGKSLPTI